MDYVQLQQNITTCFASVGHFEWLQWPCARWMKYRFRRFSVMSFAEIIHVLTMQLTDSSFHVSLVCTVNKGVVFLLQYRSYRNAVFLEQPPQRSLVHGLIEIPHVNTIHSSRLWKEKSIIYACKTKILQNHG